MINNTSSDSDNILERNCRPEWGMWTCIAANLCGLTSTTLWFVVLLPQVYKNFRRKSVAGLSILWGTANFTASLVNIFFVFMYASLPIYASINAVYMPILEFTILVQFWLYNTEASKQARYGYAGGCFVIWATIIVVQLVAHPFEEMQWVAIGLWCVETFPQIVLNLKLQSTSGQSTRSVVIATIGKMTDFLATYGLVIPLQYVVMTYFSSSVAYINTIQVAWYYRENNSSKSSDPIPIDPDTGFLSGQLRSGTDDNSGSDGSTIIQPDDDVTYAYLWHGLTIKWHRRSTRSCIVRTIVIAFIVCSLALFLTGLVLVTSSPYSALAPVGIATALASAYIYYHTRVCQKLRNKETRCHDR